MKIALGADHGGFALKENIKAFLEELGHEVQDFGAYELDRGDDYSDFVFPAAWAVADGTADRAIVFGASGQGEAMAANRVQGVRATVFYGDVEPCGSTDKVGEAADVVTLSRMDNDANVLSIAGAFVNAGDVQQAVERFLNTDFTGEERHKRRITKLDNING